MKKLFSTNYSDAAFNLSMLLLRAGFGFSLFYNYGLSKLQNFAGRKNSFSDPLHIGSTASMILVIFAEVFCALLLTAGLLTRFVAAVLTIMFMVLVFIVHKNDPVKEKEDVILFLLVFLAILFCGPGKWSLDRLIGK
jgi:putative oxidoreductase